jgi:DNA-binding XRE family transcriptional regulator
VRSLYTHLEELRRKARLSQIDAAELVKVTRRSYIAWGQGSEIQDDRIPDLKYGIFVIEQGLRRGDLPIQGHDRRSDTAERRRELIQALKRCYPNNPYSLNSAEG